MGVGGEPGLTGRGRLGEEADVLEGGGTVGAAETGGVEAEGGGGYYSALDGFAAVVAGCGGAAGGGAGGGDGGGRERAGERTGGWVSGG